MLHDFISAVIDNLFKCNFIFVNMPHYIYIYIYISVLILFMIVP